MTTNVLYRFYSKTGQLLYVGITANPGKRMKQHAGSKPWWDDVAGISMEKYATRDEVLAAETRAIAIEQPLHNIRRPTIARRRVTSGQAPRPVEHRQLVWTCEACGVPISNGQGYVHVQYDHIHEHEAVIARAKQAAASSPIGGTLVYSGDAVSILMEAEPAHWSAHHARCDPDPDGRDYFVDVARVRTRAQLLDFTAHLLGKAWIASTDLASVIAAKAGVEA